MVAAAKRIRCEVCDRNKRGSSARPASMPNLLSFNQVVALDAFSAYDALKKKAEFMIASILELGFVWQPLSRGTPARQWKRRFAGCGPTLLVLLAPWFWTWKRGSRRAWHDSVNKIRPIAAQAHWQQGSVERCTRTWKEVWVKTVDDKTGTIDEKDMLATAVNAAMNSLRRDSGHSPAQAVWGRDPGLPGDVFNEDPPQR